MSGVMPSSASVGAVGVFDSGVGGLSVLRELRRELPRVHFVYLADIAHVPYGDRSDDDIRDLSLRGVAWLRRWGVVAVVNACNTSSAFSLDPLRALYGPQFPVVGLVPALKPAVEATRSGVVGVLSTSATRRSPLLREVVERYAQPAGVRVVALTHPELVPLVEAGEAQGPRARALLRELLLPLAEAGADQLVLGCTHFPFLAPAIYAEFGNSFTLQDSGAAVARRTRQVLSQAGLNVDAGGEVEYFATAHPQRTARVMSGLLAEAVTVLPAEG